MQETQARGYAAEITVTDAIEWYHRKLSGMKKALEEGRKENPPRWYTCYRHAERALIRAQENTPPPPEHIRKRRKAVSWFDRQITDKSEKLREARTIGNYQTIAELNEKIGYLVFGRDAIEREVQQIESQSKDTGRMA